LGLDAALRRSRAAGENHAAESKDCHFHFCAAWREVVAVPRYFPKRSLSVALGRLEEIADAGRDQNKAKPKTGIVKMPYRIFASHDLTAQIGAFDHRHLVGLPAP
jgi:hypothetical protein